MKKLFYTFGSFVILTMLAVVLVIISRGSSDEMTYGDFEGDFYVVKKGDVLVPDIYLSFCDGKVTGTKGEAREIVIDDEYIKRGDYIYLSDTSYYIHPSSEYVIDLVDKSTDEVMKLVRITGEWVNNKDIYIPLEGSYDLLRVGGQAKEGEVMTFTDSELFDYRGGEIYLSSSYEYQEGIISVSKINKRYRVLSNEVGPILVETDSGYVWELRRR